MQYKVKVKAFKEKTVLVAADMHVDMALTDMANLYGIAPLVKALLDSAEDYDDMILVSEYLQKQWRDIQSKELKKPFFKIDFEKAVKDNYTANGWVYTGLPRDRNEKKEEESE